MQHFADAQGRFTFPEQLFPEIRGAQLAHPTVAARKAAIVATAPKVLSSSAESSAPGPPAAQLPAQVDLDWARSVIQFHETWSPLPRNIVLQAIAVLEQLAKADEGSALAGEAAYTLGVIDIFVPVDGPPADNSRPAEPAVSPVDRRSYLRQALMAGVHRAWYRVALNSDARGDTEQALSQFQRGADRNDAACLYTMGLAHMQGQFGLQYDVERGINLIELALPHSDPDFARAPYLLGKILVGEGGAAPSPADTQTTSGTCLGIAAVDQLVSGGELVLNVARGLDLIEHSAALGFAPALLRMADAYLSPRERGFNCAVALRYLSLASCQDTYRRYRSQPPVLRGAAEAQIVKWLLCGYEDIVAKNETWALRFAEIGSLDQNGSALFALAYFSEVGIATTQDPQRALALYQLSSARGCSAATARIAQLQQGTPQLRRTLTRKDHENKMEKHRSALMRGEACAGTAAINDESTVEGSPTGPFLGDSPGSPDDTIREASSSETSLLSGAPKVGHFAQLGPLTSAPTGPPTGPPSGPTGPLSGPSIPNLAPTGPPGSSKVASLVVPYLTSPEMSSDTQSMRSIRSIRSTSRLPYPVDTEEEQPPPALPYPNNSPTFNGPMSSAPVMGTSVSGPISLSTVSLPISSNATFHSPGGSRNAFDAAVSRADSGNSGVYSTPPPILPSGTTAPLPGTLPGPHPVPDDMPSVPGTGTGTAAGPRGHSPRESWDTSPRTDSCMASSHHKTPSSDQSRRPPSVAAQHGPPLTKPASSHKKKPSNVIPFAPPFQFGTEEGFQGLHSASNSEPNSASSMTFTNLPGLNSDPNSMPNSAPNSAPSSAPVSANGTPVLHLDTSVESFGTPDGSPSFKLDVTVKEMGRRKKDKHYHKQSSVAPSLAPSMAPSMAPSSAPSAASSTAPSTVSGRKRRPLSADWMRHSISNNRFFSSSSTSLHSSLSNISLSTANTSAGSANGPPQGSAGSIYSSATGRESVIDLENRLRSPSPLRKMFGSTPEQRAAAARADRRSFTEAALAELATAPKVPVQPIKTKRQPGVAYTFEEMGVQTITASKNDKCLIM